TTAAAIPERAFLARCRRRRLLRLFLEWLAPECSDWKMFRIVRNSGVRGQWRRIVTCPTTRMRGRDHDEAPREPPLILHFFAAAAAKGRYVRPPAVSWQLVDECRHTSF